MYNVAMLVNFSCLIVDFMKFVTGLSKLNLLSQLTVINGLGRNTTKAIPTLRSIYCKFSSSISLKMIIIAEEWSLQHSVSDFGVMLE